VLIQTVKIAFRPLQYAEMDRYGITIKIQAAAPGEKKLAY
jgi:hypothetical protein